MASLLSEFYNFLCNHLRLARKSYFKNRPSLYWRIEMFMNIEIEDDNMFHADNILPQPLFLLCYLLVFVFLISMINTCFHYENYWKFERIAMSWFAYDMQMLGSSLSCPQKHKTNHAIWHLYVMKNSVNSSWLLVFSFM